MYDYTKVPSTKFRHLNENNVQSLVIFWFSVIVQGTQTVTSYERDGDEVAHQYDLH